MKKIRILIADDHLIVREGLSAIVATQPDMALAGRAVDGPEAVSLAQALQPDIILMDLVMPRMDGVQAIREIKRANPQARVLVLTSFAHDEKVFAAIKAGALGYLLKDTTHDRLLSAIRDVAGGHVSLDPAIAIKVMREMQQPSEAPATAEALSERELETLRLIARGMSNGEIAAKLCIQERTVAKHVGSILDKLHLANRTQAALHALRKGWAELE
ncbi:MAG: response regulator transcription factor [Thermoflexales bacterium]|nr:response regulator transcription factor [Thermoflexales bacterium]